MKKAAIAFAATLIGSSAAAQECASIDNDLDRLACYDKQSGRTPSAKLEPDPVGNWTVRTDKSEFKDTTDVFLTLQSDEPVNCSQFGSPEKAMLVLRCMENTTTFYLNTNCHLTSGHGDYGRIEYRVDETKAKSRNFTESTNNKSLGLWNGGRSFPFVKELLGADKLLMRFTAYGQSPTTARFSISGLDEAIEPLRSECGW